MKMKIDIGVNDKPAFYGFRKAFIKNNSLPLESRFLLILLMTYKGKNQSCWPSIGELSSKFGKNKDTVRKYLIVLEQAGYLKINSRGIGRSRLYTPSYFKISAGSINNPMQNPQPNEILLHQPIESTLNRSISLGNKDNGFKNAKELFDEKRKELGL